MKLPVKCFPCVPVWYCGGGENNEYGDFYIAKKPAQGKKYTLKISADTDYNIYTDGKLAGFGRYSDYKEQLVYDEYELDRWQELYITAWHSGVDCMNHEHQKPYVCFVLYEDGKAVECSGTETLSRPCHRYVQHIKRLITGQLGPGFDMQYGAESEELKKSVEVEPDFDAVRPRPNEKLVLGEKIECSIVKQGFYRNADFDALSAQYNEKVTPDCGRRQRYAERDTEDGDGTYYIFDIGREEVGFPEIEYECNGDCTVDLGWGEHLADGICRVAISTRRFASELKSKKGKNYFFPALRRFGCRYLQLFIPGQSENVKINFYPTVYPVEVLPVKLEGLRKKIYDVSVHTLRCSMHEHYEDCPWREQALYTMDSRNQIMAGYKAFAGGNLKMVRASLDLISRSQRPDGLTKLCSPSGTDYPIPFFTLMYFIEFQEYVSFSGDTEFAAEKLIFLETLMDAVLSRRIKDGPFEGLCPRYPESRNIWNFYEWSPTMSGDKYKADEINPPCEAPFNAVLVRALESLAKIYESLHLEDSATVARKSAGDVREAVRRVFRRDDGCFISFTDREGTPLSVLTQAFCLLAGCASAEESAKALEIIAENGPENKAVPATLSMAAFRYDALLAADREKFAPRIIREIDDTYSYMLDRGATSFWETIKGEADFHNAGSLCHGWSSMPVYYYSLLL